MKISKEILKKKLSIMLFLKKCLIAILNTLSILQENSSLEDLPEIQDLPEEKLLLIPMVDGEAMEEVLSQEKTPPKLIDLPLMLLDGLLNHWLLEGLPKDVWFKLPMVLVFPNLSPYTLIHTIQLLKDLQIKTYLK